MGRPAGTPNKLSKEMRERASFWGDHALKRIVGLIDSPDDRVALDAAKTLMDRAYGKPHQVNVLQGDEDGGPVQVTEIRRTIVDPRHQDGQDIPPAPEAGKV